VLRRTAFKDGPQNLERGCFNVVLSKLKKKPGCGMRELKLLYWDSLGTQTDFEAFQSFHAGDRFLPVRNHEKFQ
jgi:hypothetical protein